MSEIIESNMWLVYLFLGIFICVYVFLNFGLIGILRYEDGWIVVLFFNILLTVIFAPTLLYFYGTHGRVSIIISNKVIETHSPLSKHSIGWDEFDMIKYKIRGPHRSKLDKTTSFFTSSYVGREFSKFKISFFKNPNNVKIKTIKFRLYNRQNARRVIDLLFLAVTDNHKQIELDRKYI